MNNVIDAPPQAAAQHAQAGTALAQPLAPFAAGEIGPDESAPADEPGYGVDAAGTFEG